LAQYTYLTGKAHWAKILGDPVPNFSRDGNEWTVDFTPDAEGIKTIKALGIGSKLKNKGDERGEFIQFKQRELRANGKKNDPITVVDAHNRPWDPDTKIGNDSTVEVKFNVVDYGKGKPQGVYLQALRVLDLVPYVRQEFAPLPEGSEYLKAFGGEAAEEFAEDVVEGDVLEG
jgi:hypothetical protein